MIFFVQRKGNSILTYTGLQVHRVIKFVQKTAADTFILIQYYSDDTEGIPCSRSWLRDYGPFEMHETAVFPNKLVLCLHITEVQWLSRAGWTMSGGSVWQIAPGAVFI